MSLIANIAPVGTFFSNVALLAKDSEVIKLIIKGVMVFVVDGDIVFRVSALLDVAFFTCPASSFFNLVGDDRPVSWV